MTEAEWLTCIKPQNMLDFLRGKRWNRNLRLFAVACCRRITHLSQDRRVREAIAVAECFADGLASREEMARVSAIAQIPARTAASGRTIVFIARNLTMASARHAGWYVSFQATWEAARGLRSSDYKRRQDTEWAGQAEVLRDIVGNPFRPVHVDPAWLRWHEGAILRMAQTIYDKRRFQDLPILADVLARIAHRVYANRASRII
jgi:hypothetical protein